MSAHITWVEQAIREFADAIVERAAEREPDSISISRRDVNNISFYASRLISLCNRLENEHATNGHALWPKEVAKTDTL